MKPAFTRQNIVTDIPTSRWLLERVCQDGLRANVTFGFPYVQDGRKVCAVQLDYASDDALDVSNLLVTASERASFMLFGCDSGLLNNKKMKS